MSGPELWETILTTEAKFTLCLEGNSNNVSTIQGMVHRNQRNLIQTPEQENGEPVSEGLAEHTNLRHPERSQFGIKAAKSVDLKYDLNQVGTKTFETLNYLNFQREDVVLAINVLCICCDGV